MRFVRTRITPSYNPNPHQGRNFTVKCSRNSIRTTVTATPSVVRRWLYTTRHIYGRRRHMLVGLGVQWLPGNFISTPSTLQLCVGRRCLIFQLDRAPYSPLILRRFLSNTDTTFVGVWNHRDGALLRDSKHSLSVTNLVDIRDIAAAERGYSKMMSMERLAESILGLSGVEKPESVRRSDWEADWLSEEQVEYACLDAFISFSLGKALRAWEWVGS